MSQKELLESLLKEIKHIKSHMPNGELKQMQEDMHEMKEDISDLKYTLLNPENGVIVNSNKNTDYRLELQENEKEFRNQMLEIGVIKKWKDGVNKALWIIFGSLVGIMVRMLMMHSDKL
jgi:hypothetical protein